MTMTSEQFALISTKDDLKNMEDRMDKKFSEKFDKILTVVDGIAKSFDNNEIEKYSNLEAHKRLGKNINKVRTKIGMKTVSVV